MKRKSIISLGPGAPSLILIFVVLALTMLGMLALMNGRNDARLSERSVEVVEAVYALDVRAEETRAQLDALLVQAAQQASDESQYLALAAAQLPDEAELIDRDICWTESDGLRNLHCAIRVLSLDSETRSIWIQHTLLSQAAEEADDGEDMFEW